MSFNSDYKKTTDHAIKKVCDYLLSREDIKQNLDKKNKSINGMWSYIKQEARKAAKNGCACIDDDEVYNWAVHYFDEDDLKADKDIPLKNVTTTNDNNEKKQVVPKAEEDNVQQEVPKEKKSKKRKKSSSVSDEQLSLFDFQVM
ncbi:MAG: Cas9 inhibitor AcrIIA9 family protein [Erysipelotrichaceae bacterium]|nr:Cas9 inhibitor AcrIIA9 family protein [Erysipelotrichaceae bacterium]